MVGDATAKSIAWFDLSSALVLVVIFILLSTIMWQARRNLASNPLLSFLWGVTLCVIGALIWLLLPDQFERNRGIATALVVGLGLISINSSLLVSDRGRELREHRDTKLQGIKVAEAARDQASSELKEVAKANIAPLRRELKLVRLRSVVWRSSARLRKLKMEAESLQSQIKSL
jgi:hypothetical protein